jgi:hypothetical protein
MKRDWSVYPFLLEGDEGDTRGIRAMRHRHYLLHPLITPFHDVFWRRSFHAGFAGADD